MGSQGFAWRQMTLEMTTDGDGSNHSHNGLIERGRGEGSELINLVHANECTRFDRTEAERLI